MHQHCPRPTCTSPKAAFFFSSRRRHTRCQSDWSSDVCYSDLLIAAIGVTGLGWIVAEYTRKIQAAGSLYDYVTDGLGGRVGTAAGWLYYVGMLALGAGILPMIGGTIHDTIVSEFSRAPFGYLVWDLILLVLAAP